MHPPLFEKHKDFIENAWNNPLDLDQEALKKNINDVLMFLDAGILRVAEKINGVWETHQWIKKAILLSFKVTDNHVIRSDNHCWYDKIPLKTTYWDKEQFQEKGFRCVPGSIIRRGSFIDQGAVIMPSFINIGAYVGKNTMVDTWATIGSCAQIGDNCHISGGTGIGGVLEPLQATPVIIEDNVFIGARSEIAEGVLVEEGSVISMGVFVGASTKIINRHTGETTYGRIPPYSVVVPGTVPHLTNPNHPGLACAVIVKQVDARTRAKVEINELLRG